MPNLSELLYYNGETSTQLIVWSLFIGVIIAALAGYFIKSKFGVFIRKLLENDINSPEKAVTLEELGLNKKIFIKLGLKSHSNYKNMLVAITEDGKYFANNAYTTEIPAFKEFIVVKRKRTNDAIKESKAEDEAVPLSGLAKILQSKEKAESEKTFSGKTSGKEASEIASSETTITEKDSFSVDTSTENALYNTKNKEKAPNNDINTENSNEQVSTSADINNPTSSKEVDGARFSELPKERVKFDVTKARYYIPPEIHDRAYSLYHAKTGKSNAFIQIVLLLIVLGLIATFSGNLVSGFTDFLSGIKNPFERPTI